MANNVYQDRFLTIALGSGALIDVKSGASIQNGGWQCITWTGNLATLNIDGTLDLWDGNTVYADALTGYGTVTNANTSSSATFGLTLGQNGGSGTFSGVLRNNDGVHNTAKLALTKNGAGTQTLTGANLYTGATTVAGGALILTGSLANTAITVASGATFGGTGTVAGSVAFNNGAKAALTVTSTGGADNTTPMTFAGVMTYDATQVHLNLPANLPNGIYTLATSVTMPSLSNAFPAPVVDSGSYVAGSSATSSLDTANKKLLLLVNNNVYTAWLADYPSLTGGGAALTADPDGDGLTNLVEFAFGTDPTLQSTGAIAWSGSTLTSHGMPTVSVTNIPNGVDFKAVFARRRDYLTAGLIYTVQFSVDLINWIDSTDTPTVIASDATMDAVSVPSMLIATVNGMENPRFCRVKVSD